MKRIALCEVYPFRGDAIKTIFLEANSHVSITIFRSHEHEFPDDSFDGYVISGGLVTIAEKLQYPYLAKIQKMLVSYQHKPMLGICLGHQLIADAFGGIVAPVNSLEVGFISIHPNVHTGLLDGITHPFSAFSYHWDIVSRLPDTFESLAASDLYDNQIIRHTSKPIYGCQFHIEYDEHTALAVLEYLSEEIKSEGLCYEHIMQSRKAFNKDIILRLITNFLGHL